MADTDSSEDEDELLKRLFKLQQRSPERCKQLLDRLNMVATTPFVTYRDLYDSFGELQEKLNIHVLIPYLLDSNLISKDQEYVLFNPLFRNRKQDRVKSLLLFMQNGPIPNAPTRLLQCIRRSTIEKKVPQHIELDKLLTRLSTRVNEQKHNEDQAKANAKKCLMKMKDKFASLILKVGRKLQNHSLNIEELKLYVAMLPPSEQHPECQIAQSDKRKIRSANNITDIFTVFDCGGYWDYENIHLLTCTVRQFGDQKTKDLVTDYYEELEKFKKDSEYNPADSPPSTPPIQRSSNHSSDLEHSLKFAELVTKLSLDFKQMTGINIQELLVYVLSLSDRQLSQSYIDDLMKAAETNDFSHVFSILGDYWDWQDYHVLKCIVKEFGSDDMIKMVAEYESLQSCAKAGGLETVVQEFRIKHAHIVLSTLRFLERSSTTLETFKQYIACLPTRSHPYPDQDINRMFGTTISKAETWAATFLLLNPFWDYLNFYLLRNIIDKFIRPSQSDKAKELTDDYCRSISEFQSSTQLKDLVQVLPNGNPPVQSKFVKMSLKINSNVGEKKVEFCENFRQSFISAFGLCNYTLMICSAKIHDAKIGAYSKLKCYIPSTVACLVVLEYWRKTDFFRQHNVSHVKLHNHSAKYYFSFPTTEHHQSTLKRALFVPSLAELIKAMEPDILVKVEQPQSMTSTVCDQHPRETFQTDSSQHQSSDHQPHQLCGKCRPTLPLLLKFPAKNGDINIPEKIGTMYLEFGVLLLADDEGNKVDAISLKCNKDVRNINFEILKEWIRRGNDVSWKKLTDTLSDIGHGALATDIKNITD